MNKIVGLGACVYDTLIKCPTYPDEDSKLKADDVFVSGGGPVGNALVVASKLGAQAEVIGLFGSDGAAEYLLKDFDRLGVKRDKAVKVSGARSFTSYIVLSKVAGTRTCVFDRGTVPDDPSLVDFSPVNSADILHLDGNYLSCAIEAAKKAKKLGVKVSLDAGGVYEGIEKLLPYVDILIPSAYFAETITGKKSITQAMEVLYEKYRPLVLAVTDGDKGGYYYDGKVGKYDGVKVNVVDTNGAGDTFHGAFLTAYLAGKTVEECCVYASEVAAHKCSKAGVRGVDYSRFIIG